MKTPTKKKDVLANPKKKMGRPKGSLNRKTLIEAAIQTSLVNRLEKDAEKIYLKAVELALEGDKTMIKMFMDRLIPELKLTGEENKSSSGGIQIIVNSSASDPKDITSTPLTINQISNKSDDEDIIDG